MDKVSVFESSDFGELRIIVDPKGDVWFVASDVAKSLGYINAKDAVKRHVDDDDSMLLQVSDNQWGVKRSILKTRYIDSIRIINESGLYSLILSSKLESAKRFKKWVTSEVLPSIRKTGEYKTSSGGKGILVPDFSNPADAARAWADQYEAAQKAIAEKSQAEAEKQQALKTIEEHKPDVEFAESFRKVDHIKSVLEASVDYYYPNHPEVEFEKDFNIQYDVNNILNKYGHTEMGMYKIQLYIENILGSIQNKKPVDVGEVSDGYHTFNELYRYRMLYNAAFFNLLARSGQVEVCKSRRHSDGEKCFGSDDWFIVMAILPTGQVSNHYESKYWDLFDVPERETAFEYDGHTPNEAADRLKKYLKLPRRGMTFEQALERLKLGRKIKRIDWGKKYICMFDVNILMVDTGQKVASNWNPTEHDIMSNDWEIAG